MSRSPSLSSSSESYHSYSEESEPDSFPYLWKEIRPFDSNKPDPQISRSVGWTRMQSQSCRFVSAVAASLNNTTTSYHVELNDLRTLLKHKLA